MGVVSSYDNFGLCRT